MKRKLHVVLIGLALSIGLLAGCSTKPAEEDQPGIPYEILSSRSAMAWIPSDHSAWAKKPILRALNELNDIDALGWKSREPISSPFPPSGLGEVDFSNHSVFVLSRGVCPITPCQIDVKRIDRDHDVVTVTVELIDPPGPAAAAAHEFHVVMATVNKVDLPPLPYKLRLVGQDGAVVGEETIG